MTLLLADRFLPDGRGWTDIATGQSVRVRVLDAGSPASPARRTPRDQLAWADRCASISVLRHPAINPLLDYGSCDASRVFEAYAIHPPVRASGVSASRLLVHAARFLESQGVPVRPAVAPFLMREVTAGPALGGRPIGVVLRRRAALDALVDALDAHSPAGTVHLDIVGAPASGLRTLQVLVAREARLRGYVPVSADVVARCPSLVELLPARHVCLLVEEPATEHVQRVLASVITRLGGASARRHVVVRWRRSTGSVPSAVLLDPLGAAAMMGMVFVDHEFGPSAEELFEAARVADGKPGVFLRTLHAVTFGSHQSQHAMVHEAPQPYDAGRECDVQPDARPEGPARAEALAQAGRHAAACRLLMRAARVLEGRGDRVAAARCACALGWIVRARGRSERALEWFDRATALAGEAPQALDGAIGRGVVQTDEGRLVEAEATLRGVSVAAHGMGDTLRVRAASLALGRALMWQGRQDEASSVLMALLPPAEADPLGTEIWALTARVRVLEGQVRNALEAARRAIEAAGRDGEPRRRATANRAMAIVLVDLGDREGASEHVRLGLAAARAAHLPLLALKLRLLMPGPPNEPSPRLRRSAGALRAQAEAGHYDPHTSTLPRLLDAQVRAAAGTDIGDVVRDTGACALLARVERRPFAQLETLLEMSHDAPDERAAVDRISTHVCTELRASTTLVSASTADHRVVTLVGKPWHGDMSVCAQALGSGRSVPPDPGRQPPQAAEPIRYGGIVIAALACRWTAGTSVSASATADVLRAAALAAAASVHALLEEPAPSTMPPSGSRELLGESGPALALREAITRAARAPFSVLIEGESGSGKELVAHAIHRLSARRDRRWCAVNCAAIADDLLEAELFGHARGAFTGATGERAGLFEEADGGTLFLDEVGDLSPRAQAKLLRVLQDGEVRRVGENLPRRVDVRVVAATNHRLDEDAAAGRFRADLRFRLDVVRIVVPPLRDRIADIPLLAMHFWRSAAGQVDSCATLAPETLSALARYDWPGNVRELQNVIAWMAVHSPRRGRVGPSALPARLAQATAPSSGTFEVAREEFERRFIRAALARAGGQRSRAADALGVSRQGLAKMLRRLNIEGP
jgi:DNA-binding NtrC family response regulator/tetratricopeptide (TPR) repeat protein